MSALENQAAFGSEEDYFAKFGLPNVDQQTGLLSGSERKERKGWFQIIVGIIIIASFVLGCIFIIGGTIVAVMINSNVLNNYCVMQFEFNNQVPYSVGYIYDKLVQSTSKTPYSLKYAFRNNYTISCVHTSTLKDVDEMDFVLFEDKVISRIVVNASSYSTTGVFDMGQNYRNIINVVGNSGLGKDYLQKIVDGCN